MEICIESLLEGARRAEGAVVVIDVYRAFTTAAVALARGAAKILVVPEVREALRLRERGAGDLCVGEVHGEKPEGFDLGNSPHEVASADVAGKTIILSTRAGAVGLAAAAPRAERLFAAALVNARATADVLRAAAPRTVTLLAMGWEGAVRSDEDEQCALYLRNLIEGRRPDPGAVRALVLGGGESQKFGDSARPYFRPEDRDLALQIDRFPFAIEVRSEEGFLVGRAVHPARGPE